MANENEIKLEIFAEIGNKKSFKSIQDYTNFLESQIGKSIDKSMLTPLDDAGKKWQALIKNGRKYQQVILNTSEKGKKLESFDIKSERYSLKEARQLSRIRSFSDEKAIKGEIAFQRKAKISAEKSKIQAKKLENNEGTKSIEITRALNDLMIKSAGSNEKQALIIKKWRDELSLLKKEYEEVAQAGGDTSKIETNIANASKELSKALEGKKIGGWTKLINTFKRVGFYRLARRLFQLVEQGFSKGIQDLILFDNQTNKTMSSMSSSFDKINASIALMVAPLIQLAEPIISGLANGISDFANKISMASADMKGLSEYTKINEEYMKDLQESANSTLLSFDKFESLTGPTSPFEPGEISDEDKEDLEKYKETINSLKTIFESIWKVIKSIGKGFLDVFQRLEPYWDDISDFIVLAISGVTDFIVLLGKVVAKVSEIVDTKESLYALLTIVAAIITLIGVLTGNVGAIVAGALGLVGSIGLNIGLFANGGMPDRGSLFVAGEAGAEFVTKMPSGQTGVTNIAQFKQAMIEALYECSDLFQQGDGSVVLELDGAQVARSKRFKSELNRTNAGLNLR